LIASASFCKNKKKFVADHENRLFSLDCTTIGDYDYRIAFFIDYFLLNYWLLIF